MNNNSNTPTGESLADYKPLLIPFILGVLPFIGSSLLLYVIKNYPNIIESNDLMVQLGILTVMTLTLAIGLMHASSAAIALGYYLKWKGLVVFGIPYLIACSLGYFASGFLGTGRFNQFLAIMYPKWNLHAKDATKNPFAYIFFLRLTPIFPFAITNYLIATLKINYWKMIVASAAGQLPRTALFIWVGTLISDWMSWMQEGSSSEFKIWQKLPGNTSYYWLGLVLLGVVALWVLWKRAEKLSKEEVQKDISQENV